MTQESSVIARRGRPSKSGYSPEETREHLIRRGVDAFTLKGFSSAGLDEILRLEKVPKGSFYHYFKNKEAFGEAVIAEYAQYFANKLDRNFKNVQLSPMQRLQSFVAEACEGMKKHDFERGCLIGNLGQELGSLPIGYREQLNAVLQQWEERLSSLLLVAIEWGEVEASVDVGSLAAFFWVGWEGAILKAKLEKSDESMRLFEGYFIRLCNCRA